MAFFLFLYIFSISFSDISKVYFRYVFSLYTLIGISLDVSLSNNNYWNDKGFKVLCGTAGRRRMVRVGLLLLLTYTTIPRNGSKFYLEQSLRDANNAVLGALPGTGRSRNFYGYRIGWLCRLWFTGAKYGAGNSHFVRLVAGWSGTSSGIRREPRRSTAHGQALSFDYPDKVVDKVVFSSRHWSPVGNIEQTLTWLMQRLPDKQRDKSVSASVKSFDNSVPYGEISRTSTEKYFGGK